jgi:hypothetical protein
MNFYFSRSKQVENFYGLHEHRSEDNYIYLDDGWTQKDDYFFKGISSSWCKIYFGHSLRIETNKLRDFPIYHNNKDVSNFVVMDQNVPVNGMVSFNDSVHITYDGGFYPRLPNDVLTFKECKDLLYDAVIENVGTFAANNTKKILMPDQNGIDTLTVRSVFDHLGVGYKLFRLNNEKPSLTQLGTKLAEDHWGFAQIREDDGCVVVGGYYGDEWGLRNPYYVNALLSNRGVSLIDCFDATGDCYMKKYFEKYRTKCENQTALSREQVMSQICNDFQIWHLHGTTFLSPLKHYSLLSLLSADTDTIISQVTDAKLSKAIIQDCNPTLLVEIDVHKNQDDPSWFPE